MDVTPTVLETLDPGDLLTRTQVARLLAVSPATLHRWEHAGLIHAVVLPSGQHRYRVDQVIALRSGGGDV